MVKHLAVIAVAAGWRLLPALAITSSLLLAGSPSVVDLEGSEVDPLSTDAQATVLVFTRTDCPISNRYAPELRRLHESFAERGVTFWLVYPDPDETVPEIRAHVEAYGYRLGVLRDLKHRLKTLTEARVTPEVVVFDAEGLQVYRGRIDDRFVDFGKARPQPTRRDLELALTSLLEGRPVDVATTKAVGCFIPPL